MKPPELDKQTLKYIKSALRRIWGWHSERKLALKRAQITITSWRCEVCFTEPLTRKERQVDHIVSVESTGEQDGLFGWISRLFVPASQLQVLCLKCHKAKTTKQSAERRRARKGVTK